MSGSDFRRVSSGQFDRALPDGTEEHPDPLDGGPGARARLDLEARRFDRRQYETTLSRVKSDRAWETRARAVVRIASALRPWGEDPWRLRTPWTDGDDVVLVSVPVEGRLRIYAVPVPAGPVEDAAAELAASLAARGPGALDGSRVVRR